MALLENETLLLRALEPEDLDTLYRWENDSELWQYGTTLAPYSRFTLKEYLSDSRLDIFQTRQLRLMIVLKEAGISIGTIDLYDFDLMNLRAGVGILIESAYRNRGLGTQVLNLIEEYAFRFLLLKQLYAYIPQSNFPSMKLFARCGYEQTGHLYDWIKTEDGFKDVLVMQLIRGNQ